MVLTHDDQVTNRVPTGVEGRQAATHSILWPDHQPDRAVMGGKAAVLALLATTCPIPDWFVITPHVLADMLAPESAVATITTEIDEATVEAIITAVAQLDSATDARFAVRSSAIAEDGDVASFAGQLESFLNVSANEVVARVQDVCRSGAAAHVQAYQQLHTGADKATPAVAPAVIVQRMVAADVAGVAFGADPVTGDRQICVISAVAGLADQLVSGRVNGDTYRTDRAGVLQTQTLVDDVPLLLPSQVREVVELLIHVEAEMDTPQDIEWAFAEGRIYLLQARPITTLSRISAGDGPQNPRHMNACLDRPRHLATDTDQRIIWDNSNIVESYSGVTSPLTFSFARHVYEHVYMAFCRMMGVPPAKIAREQNAFQNMLGHINGHVYYNLINWYRVLALFPGFQMNRRFMEQMMGVKEPLAAEFLDEIAPQQANRWARFVDGLQLARAGLGLVHSQLTLDRTIRRFYARLDDALQLSMETIQTLPLPRLLAEYERVEQELLAQWDAPLINDFLCMIAFGLSRKVLEQQAGEAGLQLHSELLIGQGAIISAEPAKRIREMATLAATDEAVVATLIAGDPIAAQAALATIPALQAVYDAYLTRFGNRCLQELKLESPTLHDDPRSLLQAIGQMARRLPLAYSSGQPQAETTIPVATQLTPFFKNKPLKRWFVGKVVQWAKDRVRDRENLRFERTRVFGYARQIFLAIGARLTEAGLLAAPREIFYLEIDEVRAVIEERLSHHELHLLLARRAADAQTFAELPPPPNRFESRDGTMQPPPATTIIPSDQDQITRKGTGCCAGIVRAPVRVIDDPRTATLLPGEIMVARFTDPGWITLFTNASGILVERGSLLSHSAIVARELGIPAIVAIDGVMDWLETGDLVEMDGATGIVKRDT